MRVEEKAEAWALGHSPFRQQEEEVGPAKEIAGVASVVEGKPRGFSISEDYFLK